MPSRTLALVLFCVLLGAAGASGYLMLERGDAGARDRGSNDVPENANGEALDTAPSGPGSGGATAVELEPLVSWVTDRYEARLIDASVTSTRSREAVEVYELRFLTRQGNVLRVRFDAATGDWLETEGRGQTEARKLPER